MFKQLVCAVTVGAGLLLAQMAHAEPSVKSCAYLIDQAFFYHTYETVCQKIPTIGIAMGDRFDKQGCTKVLSDEQIKAIRDDVLARVKAELKPQDSLSGVEVFCLNHSGAYHNILTIQ